MADPQMWFLRGVQSAIFYYLSCAPCTKAATHKKRRKQNARDRKEREALELELPDNYRQPSPFRTNQYWAEEIRLGPGPPPRRSARKQREKRKKAAMPAGRGRVPIDGPHVEGTEGNSSADLMSVDGVKNILRQAAAAHLPSKETWRRNQREDEELWGSPFAENLDSRHGPIRQPSVGGSSVGFPGLSQPAKAKLSVESFYTTTRSPPVNEMHPPVVSRPGGSKLANRWMLQPPPPASVMNGFESSSDNRSRSGSGGSGGSYKRGDNVRLQRQISDRLIADKLRRGDQLPQVPASLKTLMRGRTIDSLNDDTISEAQALKSKQRLEESTESTQTIVHHERGGEAISTSIVDRGAAFGTPDSGVEITPMTYTNVAGSMSYDCAIPHRKLPELAILTDPLQATPISNLTYSPTKPVSHNKGTTSASTSPRKAKQAANFQPVKHRNLAQDPKPNGNEKAISRVFSTPAAKQDAFSDPRSEARTMAYYALVGRSGSVDDDADIDADSAEDDADDNDSDDKHTQVSKGWVRNQQKPPANGVNRDKPKGKEKARKREDTRGVRDERFRDWESDIGRRWSVDF